MRRRVLHLSQHRHFLALVGNEESVAVLEHDVGAFDARHEIVETDDPAPGRGGITQLVQRATGRP